MDILRRVEDSSNFGYLFEFIIDPTSPDKPEFSKLKHYYIVSSNKSNEYAFCFLFISISSEMNVNIELPRWVTLYCRIFNVETHENFIKLLINIVGENKYNYAFFTEESKAYLALNELIKKNRNKSLSIHLVQTPRDIETINSLPYQPMEIIKNSSNEEDFLQNKNYHHDKNLKESKDFEFSIPITNNNNNNNNNISRELLEEQLKESQELLQLERTKNKKEITTLRNIITPLEENLKNIKEDYEKQLFYHINDYQNIVIRLENDMKQREIEICRNHNLVIEKYKYQIQELTEENKSLFQRYNEICIELERWRMECQELKHRVNDSVIKEINPLNSVSKNKYNDLEIRHHLLHKEFDEVKIEKVEVERKLYIAKQEIERQHFELEGKMQILDSLTKGLDYVQRELPLVCKSYPMFAL